MNAVLGARLRRDRLPVRDATAVPATDRAHRPVTLDVGLRRIWGSLDRHRAPLEINPWAADSAAQRAVAGRRGLRRRRQSKADGAAVTRTLVHFRSHSLDLTCDQSTRKLTFAASSFWPRGAPPRPRLAAGSAANHPRIGDADVRRIPSWTSALEPVDRSRFARPTLNDQALFTPHLHRSGPRGHCGRNTAARLPARPPRPVRDDLRRCSS